MALDSAAKRFAMLDFDLPTQPGMVPPDGADSAFDRFSLLWLFFNLPGVIVNLVAPKVFGGWRRGLEFRAGPGVYSPAVGDNDATYQWYKDGVAVPGETGHNYSPGRRAKGSTVYFTETVPGPVTTTSNAVVITNFVLEGYRNRGR